MDYWPSNTQTIYYRGKPSEICPEGCNSQHLSFCPSVYLCLSICLCSMCSGSNVICSDSEPSPDSDSNSDSDSIFGTNNSIDFCLHWGTQGFLCECCHVCQGL